MRKIQSAGHSLFFCCTLLALPCAIAQIAVAPSSQTVTSIPLSITSRAVANQPFTVAGPHGVLLGEQQGNLEAWVLPIKLLSHLQIQADVEGYAVPIDMNAAAAQITVSPDHTTITYSHIALTLRQTMFAPTESPKGTGAVIVFEVESVRPVHLTFRFVPEVRPMWPQPGGGSPSAEWIPASHAYILHTDFADLAGAVAMPGAEPGIMAPYQEKPKSYPLELHVRFDPKRDAGKRYALLMAAGRTTATATNAALLGAMAALDQTLPQLYRQHQERYAQLQAGLTSIESPNEKLDDAFQWAVMSIEQLQASLASGETGLVAGYFASGDSARPGFGWFFGRDALYTLYAVDGMGDFRLTRASLEFLLARQRADGKMMHEYSQTAGSVDWASLPYEYAAADATPLFLMAMADYVRTSGDISFLKQHGEAVRKAWQFESTRDADGDGIYDNAQGTGWVESWPGGQPHQEIYLALLDRQASTAMAELAALMGDGGLAKAASARAGVVNATIEREYYLPESGQYAFSRNADGSLDKAATIYPLLAYWGGGAGLQHAEKSFARWDSHDFSTDWGARDVAESDPVYDPISYHQGSVWPLFTGWAAMADYRSGHNLSGFAHVWQNAGQTFTQDLGAVTELLSGAYFQPFGRSTSHQLWSSAMVITPILQGIFGLAVDGAGHRVTVAPHLPADWAEAWVRRVHVGESVCDLEYTRLGDRMEVRAVTLSGPAVGVNGPGNTASVALQGVEVAMEAKLPAPGARTEQVKVLGETYGARSLTLELEGQAGSSAELRVRRNGAGLKVVAEGAALSEFDGAGMAVGRVRFGAGVGYVPGRVFLKW